MVELLETTSWAADPDVDALHRRCGVYTQDSVVRTLLDAVSWKSDADLSDKRLLEPAAGDGAFVLEAAFRLCESMKCRGIVPTPSTLEARITAFEIHPVEATRARMRICTILMEHGLSEVEADLVSRRWVRNEDFLTSELPERSFTHVVGNPPYSRWCKVPATLRDRYEAALPRRMTHGDLFLPFLDLGIGHLQIGGQLGFVCSNRWRYMAFAEGFRRERLPEVTIELDEAIDARQAYIRNVDTYPSLLVLRRATANGPSIKRKPVSREVTLADAGYHVRVGPALGVTPAFVLEPGEYGIEPELLAPWVNGSDILEGEMDYRGRQVIALYDDHGKLRNLDDFPCAKARLEAYKPRLENRSIVRKGAEWFRPIDRVVAANWQRPKLLIPEMATVPRVALDQSGAVPSHGVYAIFAPDDNLSDLYKLLRDGGLLDRLIVSAPKVKGEYFRCYKRFLDRLPL